jgi:post-segregation antitoxin (ccd killing protein)
MRWQEENKASFDSYNRMIEERGPLSEDIGLSL